MRTRPALLMLLRSAPGERRCVVRGSAGPAASLQMNPDHRLRNQSRIAAILLADKDLSVLFLRDISEEEGGLVRVSCDTVD